MSNPWRPHLSTLFVRAIREYSDSTAVQHRSRRRTFGELGDRAARLANGLRSAGLVDGSAVAVLLPNDLCYPEVDVALAVGGFVRVALNVRLTGDELSYIVDDCGAGALITTSEYDQVAGELVDRHQLVWIRLGADGEARAQPYEDLISRSSNEIPMIERDHGAPAWISYTSGTTGRPKGVVLSHGSLAQVAFNIMIELGPIRAGKSILLPQPLSHGAGFFVLPYLLAGGTVHIMSGFDPEEAMAIGRREDVNTLKLVPAMLADVVSETDGPSPFDTIIYGAAPIAASQLDQALDRFGPILVQIYGQSEAPVTLTVLHKEDHVHDDGRAASAGRVWRTVDARVVGEDGNDVGTGDLGELVIRGPHLMDGYHGLPNRTAEVLKGGWLWTRDLAKMDASGFVYLQGRMDEMINSGGFNIAPKEVENAVATHPAVDECVAVGRADDRFGELVHVFVTARDGRDIDVESLIDFCREPLGFRRPRSVTVLDKFPRTAYGKVDRSQLAVPEERSVAEDRLDEGG